MYASSPPSAAMALSHFHARAHPSFHSCKYTLLTIFFKGNKKKTHWITAGQWVKAGHHGNKLRGTGAGCVCKWDGGELVSVVLVLGKVRGGLLQEQLLHLIS